jgi:hypothetical protein
MEIRRPVPHRTTFRPADALANLENAAETIARQPQALEASHNKTKLKLAKAAPGLFFALFGAAILIVAVTRSFDFTDGAVHVIEHVDPH